MWLLISCEMLLRFCVKFYHCISERVCELLEGWSFLEHGSIEGAVNLLQGFWTWEVYEDQGTVA